jgi:hypothetical protein
MRHVSRKFPGTEVTGEQQHLVEHIKVGINPKKLPPLEVLKLAVPVGKEVFRSDFFAGSDSFYLLCEHPVLQGKKRLFFVDREELLAFLNAEINPDRMEGLDITVARPDLCRFLICNHDGEMYLLSTS